MWSDRSALEPAIPETAPNRSTKAELAKRVRTLERRLQKLEREGAKPDTPPAQMPGADKWQVIGQIAEGMPFYLAWKDRNLVYLGCNRAQARAAGFDDPADIVGLTDFDLPWTKEEAELYRKSDRKVIRTGESLINREATQRRADGTTMNIITSKVPMRDAKGRIIGVISIFADITGRKQAETALQKSEERFRTLVDTIPHGIQEIDTEGTITFANPAHSYIYGMTGEEIVGRSLWEFDAAPEDLKAYIKQLVREHPPPEPYITKKITADAREIDVQVDWTYKRDNKGQIAGFVGVITDITERQQAEAALRDSEERSRAVLDTVADGIIAIDRHGIVRAFNPGAAAIFGYAPDEVIGKNVRKLMPASDSRKHNDYVANYLETGIAKIIGKGREVTGRRKDGSTFPMELSVMEMSVAGERSFTGVVRDITERKQLEEALRLSEERYRAISNVAPVGIFRADTNGYVTFVNNKWCQLGGMKSEAAMGEGWLKAVHPDDRQRVASDWQKAATADILFENEYRYVDADGVVTWCFVQALPELNEAGEVTGYVGALTDVTERKRIEERFQKYFQIPLVGSAIYAPDKTWIEVNDAMCEILGYSREELTALTWANLTHPDDLDENIGLFDEAMAGKRDTYSINMRFIRKDGEIVHASISVQCVRKADRSPDYFLLLLQDTTEQKRTEAQLRQAQKSEAVGQLTGGIAHDFNNILGIVLGNLDLLDEKLDENDPSKRFTKAAIAASLRGAEQTQRLLSFARQQPLTPRQTEVNTLVSNVTGMLERTVAASIEIRTDIAGGLWKAIVDAGQLENALINLALNGRDAMPDGGILTLEAANVSVRGNGAGDTPDLAPGDYVMVAVTDTGTGMPLKVIERAFDPFFTTKQIGKGSGLGLSMVYGFIKQSSGHVRIESEPGKGTVVRLYLTRAGDTAQPARRANTQPGDTLTAGSGETILVVEDNPDLRVTAVTLLNSLGYDVLEAEDGASALTQLEANGPVDLMFTDVVIPGGMNGRKLAEEAVRRHPGLKVLFTSGYTEDAIIRRGQASGVELLAKPYKKRDLGERIRAVLDDGAV